MLCAHVEILLLLCKVNDEFKLDKTQGEKNIILHNFFKKTYIFMGR